MSGHLDALVPDIPCAWVSSCDLLGELVPGNGLVVEGVRFEAAIKDADEAVAELTQG